MDRYQASRSGTREGKDMAANETTTPVPVQAIEAGTPERRLLAMMRLHAITAVHG